MGKWKEVADLIRMSDGNFVPFAMSRYADGELALINVNTINPASPAAPAAPAAPAVDSGFAAAASTFPFPLARVLNTMLYVASAVNAADALWFDCGCGRGCGRDCGCVLQGEKVKSPDLWESKAGMSLLGQDIISAAQNRRSHPHHSHTHPTCLPALLPLPLPLSLPLSVSVPACICLGLCGGVSGGCSPLCCLLLLLVCLLCRRCCLLGRLLCVQG